ncbi:MAG: beta-lactamase family protein [Gemmatimonadaceae bacterium]|nr:beta-lactamase family protein [Gemmatimonadaceae bacterium]
MMSWIQYSRPVLRTAVTRAARWVRVCIFASASHGMAAACATSAQQAGGLAPAVVEAAVLTGRAGARLDSVASAAADSGFRGVVLVAIGDTVVLARGYGWADSARGRPNVPSTIFDIGSLTKPLTATLVLALEAQGRIARTDSLHRFYPAAPADKRGITIHQLLTHTAGLPEYSGRDTAVIDRATLERRALTAPLLSAPGARYRYSNVGYSLLAAIVERASGEEYEAALRRLVLAPAGMRTTGYIAIGPPLHDRIARRYKGDVDTGINPRRVWGAAGPSWNVVGNGGLHATAWDLHRWIATLDGGRLLPAIARAAQEAPYACMGVDDSGTCSDHYGYGWHLWSLPNETRVMMHNGSDGGYYAEVRRVPGRRVNLIVMSNRASPLAERIAARLMAHALRFAPP